MLCDVVAGQGLSPFGGIERSVTHLSVGSVFRSGRPFSSRSAAFAIQRQNTSMMAETARLFGDDEALRRIPSAPNPVPTGAWSSRCLGSTMCSGLCVPLPARAGACLSRQARESGRAEDTSSAFNPVLWRGLNLPGAALIEVRERCVLLLLKAALFQGFIQQLRFSTGVRLDVPITSLPYVQRYR